MQLPEKYKWLITIGVLPRMIEHALHFFGIKEIPGSKSNPLIMNMAKELQVQNIYTNDDISWCALFQSYICKIANKPMPYKAYQVLRAASFTNWGNKVEKGDEKLGDILVFKRPGGHHVGMYIAESDKTFFVLGGNQGNSVNIAEIAKGRLIACRRHYAVGPPASVKKYKMTASGVVSTNEA